MFYLPLTKGCFAALADSCINECTDRVKKVDLYLLYNTSDTLFGLNLVLGIVMYPRYQKPSTHICSPAALLPVLFFEHLPSFAVRKKVA